MPVKLVGSNVVLDENNKAVWKVFANELCEPHGGNLLLECDLNKQDLCTNSISI